MPQLPLCCACICYFSNGKEHVQILNNTLGSVPLLWLWPSYRSLELRIQAPCHRLECACLYYPVWKVICCYPFHSCLLDFMVGLCIKPVGWGNKDVSQEANVASGFLLHYRWSWQLVDREGLPIGLTLRSKRSSCCSVLGSTNIVGQNLSCRAGP